MTRTLTIEPRFCGPSNSANGGYSCGLVAASLVLPAQVRLMQPPPLGKPLSLEEDRDGTRLHDGERDIARGRTTALEMKVPKPPGFEQAEEVMGQCKAFANHPFPGCFVCGPGREADGLRIFPGPVDGQVASPWVPGEDLTDEQGRVRPEFIWAALDCPGSFALTPTPGKWMVLGSFTVDINGTVKTGERCVVTGWEIERDGRKHFAGTALFNGVGEEIARGKAIWIEIDPY
jgi:hypothetical protein